MRFHIVILFLISSVVFFPTKSLFAYNEDKVQATQIIHSSEKVVKKLLNNEDLLNMPDYLKNARAIIIFPEVYEGGFFLGAKGGNGVLLVRIAKNKYAGPFFYSIGGVSLGLQFGVKSARVIMTIMTNRGLKSLLKERIKLGVDVDAAVINQGVGFSAESTIRLADVYSFSDNTGLFIGGSLEGTYLQPRNDFNRAIHGNELSADDILRNKISKKEINNLVQIISNVKSK